MYMVELWYITNNSVNALESLVQERLKLLLGLPWQFLNIPACNVISLKSAKAIIQRKLGYRITIEDCKCPISSESVCLVRECRDLECFFEMDFTIKL